MCRLHQDDHVGRLREALEGAGMWNNTVLVWTSDNGGFVYFDASSSACCICCRHGGCRSECLSCHALTALFCLFCLLFFCFFCALFVAVVAMPNRRPVYNNGTPGANNFPLRGGKMSSWEGGIRVPAFVSGGRVPTTLRGTSNDALSACGHCSQLLSHLTE